MKLSSKQVEFIEYVNKLKFVMQHEVDKSRFPASLIQALINKGALSIYKNKITSNI